MNNKLHWFKLLAFVAIFLLVKGVDFYYIVGNNCTTIVCDGLRAGGASVPRTVGTPYGFVNWQVRSGLPYVPTHSWGF